MTSKFDTAANKILAEQEKMPWYLRAADALPGSAKAYEYAGLGADLIGGTAAAFLPVPGGRVRALNAINNVRKAISVADKAGDAKKVVKLKNTLDKLRKGSDKVGSIPVGPNVVGGKTGQGLKSMSKSAGAATLTAKGKAAADTYDFAKVAGGEIKTGFYGSDHSTTNVPDMRNINPKTNK